MKSRKILLVTILLLFITSLLTGAPSVRIKDIAYLNGIRNNQLLGIGLVTGLAGKGDSQGSELLKNLLSNLLSNFNIRVTPNDLKSKNCAVVMVSADVPPFVRPGDRMDITVSSIGDAKSLDGGVLLQTNLKAANGSVYAVAQGKIVTPKNPGSIKTVGAVPAGANIEREVLSTFVKNGALEIVLRNADFVTANAVAEAVKKEFPSIEVNSIDAALIQVPVPDEYKEDIVGFIAKMEAITVSPDMPGKVVIDPAGDIIIIGENVRIGKVAVSYKQIKADVGNSWGDEDEMPESFVLEETTSLEDFVEMLKTVGLKTEAIIGILQAIDKAGALYGTLVIM